MAINYSTTRKKILFTTRKKTFSRWVDTNIVCLLRIVGLFNLSLYGERTYPVGVALNCGGNPGNDGDSNNREQPPYDLMIFVSCFTDKDVIRTDRKHPFYKEEPTNTNTKKLYDILMTYCMYNFDLGKKKKSRNIFRN